MAHVTTQAPYALVPGMFAIIWGTLPVAYGAYPNGVALLLGFITMLLIALFVGVKVINESGKFDVFTELYLKLNKTSPLHELKNDTKQAYTQVETGDDIDLAKYVSNPKKYLSNPKKYISNPKKWFEKEKEVEVDTPFKQSEDEESSDDKELEKA